MSRKKIRHELALMEQDRIFRHYAHIRQKIYAALFVAGVLLAWYWLINYDPVHIWYAPLVVPLVLIGIWYMVTPHNYLWEILTDSEE